jgi:hypothetical protein
LQVDTCCQYRLDNGLIWLGDGDPDMSFLMPEIMTLVL